VLRPNHSFLCCFLFRQKLACHITVWVVVQTDIARLIGVGGPWSFFLRSWQILMSICKMIVLMILIVKVLLVEQNLFLLRSPFHIDHWHVFLGWHKITKDLVYLVWLLLGTYAASYWLEFAHSSRRCLPLGPHKRRFMLLRQKVFCCCSAFKLQNLPGSKPLLLNLF